MHTFPAILPVWVSQEAREYFDVEVALVLEVAVKNAVRQAGARIICLRDTLSKP